MWLLARMQSREMPSPPCLQVTGVAADPRRQGTHTVAIGCLLGDGQPGACISRGCKGAGPGVTGTRQPGRRRTERRSARAAGAIVPRHARQIWLRSWRHALSRVQCRGGEHCSSGTCLSASRVDVGHVLEAHPRNGVKGVKERLRFADQVKRGLFKHLSRTGIAPLRLGAGVLCTRAREGRAGSSGAEPALLVVLPGLLAPAACSCCFHLLPRSLAPPQTGKAAAADSAPRLNQNTHQHSRTLICQGSGRSCQTGPVTTAATWRPRLDTTTSCRRLLVMQLQPPSAARDQLSSWPPAMIHLLSLHDRFWWVCKHMPNDKLSARQAAVQ